MHAKFVIWRVVIFRADAVSAESSERVPSSENWLSAAKPNIENVRVRVGWNPTASHGLLHRQQPVRHGYLKGALVVELVVLHDGKPHPRDQAGRHERVYGL